MLISKIHTKQWVAYGIKHLELKQKSWCRQGENCFSQKLQHHSKLLFFIDTMKFYQITKVQQLQSKIGRVQQLQSKIASNVQQLQSKISKLQQVLVQIQYLVVAHQLKYTSCSPNLVPSCSTLVKVHQLQSKIRKVQQLQSKIHRKKETMTEVIAADISTVFASSLATKPNASLYCSSCCSYC